jgi:superfamily I DNA/RNA helicase/RecB family exonuclease
MAIKGFVRAAQVQATRHELDESQAAIVSLPDAVSAAVLGAPGSGKTTTIVELVADRVLARGWSPEEVLVLTPSRASATRLRDELSLRLAVPTNGPLARTVNSLAFEIVTDAARHAGAPLPRLVTGGDQDADISQLLDGHIDEGIGPDWPEMLGPEVRRLRGFRTELRELLSRATEYGVSTAKLRSLGETTNRPEWRAAADFFDEYFEVVTASRPNQLDSAELVRFAVTALDPDAGFVSDRVAGLRLVVVDDLQEATESTLALVRALAARGVAVIAFGDPDVAANAFRGGEPDALGRLATVLGVPVEQRILSTVHRQSPALRAFTSRVTDRIGTAAAGAQRSAVAVGAAASTPPVLTIEAPSPGRTWASIARVLREHHLVGGVPWSRMAVVLRSGAQVPAAARALALAEVPSRTSVGGRALRDDHAARALLLVVDIGTRRTELSPELAVEILTGPFGGLDRLGLRRLRLALRAEEIAGDGNRSSDELLVEALEAPGRFATIDHRVARAAERVSAMLAAVLEASTADATIEELLWLVWERSKLADGWFDQALGAGIVADEVNRHLDGIVSLFTAAKRFVEREPNAAASVFLANVLDAEVPEDTLSPQPAADTVFVTTPPGVVGLEYDVVVVAGVQEGGWPNLRLRGSLLYPQELVRIVTGVEAGVVNDRKQVLGDELRMFALAVSRATTQVVVAAVANDDEARSVFFSLVPPDAVAGETVGQTPLSLRGLTGRLRRELVARGRTGREGEAAASALARLAAEGVPGADPAEWHGLLSPSSDEPLFLDDEQVPVSPSQLSKFEDSPIDWFIESISGSEPNTAMAVGTIVHWAMEHATEPSVEALWAAIESRWNELSFEAPWMGEHQKRATRILAAGVAEYLADFARDGKTLVGAESRFGLDIGRARVNGSIDRVERSDDGAVVIVDLKTGRPMTRQEDIDAHPQLGAYQLAYAEGVLDEFLASLGAHSSGGAKLLFVKSGIRKKLYREAVQAPLDDGGLEAFRTRIREAADGMAKAYFTGLLELEGWGSGDPSRALHRVRSVSSD